MANRGVGSKPSTGLLGRLLPLFTGTRRVKDLFTEAVARLFERRPELCLSWLDGLDLTTSLSGEEQRNIRVTTLKSFVALDEHGLGSRPDLIIEVHQADEYSELESSIDIVMIESKIGSVEEHSSRPSARVRVICRKVVARVSPPPPAPFRRSRERTS